MKACRRLTLGAVLLVPAVALAAPPAPVQAPTQAPAKAVQAPAAQAPVQAPAKGATAMAPNYGYRTYSYEPAYQPGYQSAYRSYSYAPTAPAVVNYGVGNPRSAFRPVPAVGFNAAGFKATGQPPVP
jgi:hypothetical protein